MKKIIKACSWKRDKEGQISDFIPIEEIKEGGLYLINITFEPEKTDIPDPVFLNNVSISRETFLSILDKLVSKRHPTAAIRLLKTVVDWNDSMRFKFLGF